mgnify:CR=1 FL=1
MRANHKKQKKKEQRYKKRLDQVSNNDPELTYLNFTGEENVDLDIIPVIQAMRNNTHIERLNLHNNKITHRDLKPENILINVEGNVKVIDFGIAQLLNDKKDEFFDKKRFIGTPIYMSPEQRENPETAWLMPWRLPL